MRVRVNVRVGQWLLVTLASTLLAGGLLAILALDASAGLAVAGERGDSALETTATEDK